MLSCIYIRIQSPMDYNTNTPDEIRDLIGRFLQHQATSLEIERLEEWLKSDPSHREQFNIINRRFQAGSSKPRFKSVDDAWNTLSDKLEENEGAKIISLPGSELFLRIAASIVIIAIAGFGALKYLDHKGSPELAEVVQAAPGEKRHLTLPDGTNVWLNAGSFLKYGDDFGETSRNVELRGEAFFDVTKTGIDFVVQTNNFVIQVKGTRFNVSAFQEHAIETTTLEEGHVVLKIKGSDQFFDLKPGDQIRFDPTANEVTRQIVNAPSYSVWKEDPLHFQNTTLEEILSELEKRYAVTISIDSVISRREHLSITITDESLEEVLELISLSSSLHYRIQADRVEIYH